MSADDIATISFRLPTKLREKIKTQAIAEERTESGFLRYHLGEFFKMAESETSIEEEGEAK